MDCSLVDSIPRNAGGAILTPMTCTGRHDTGMILPMSVYRDRSRGLPSMSEVTFVD